MGPLINWKYERRVSRNSCSCNITITNLTNMPVPEGGVYCIIPEMDTIICADPSMSSATFGRVDVSLRRFMRVIFIPPFNNSGRSGFFDFGVESKIDEWQHNTNTALSIFCKNYGRRDAIPENLQKLRRTITRKLYGNSLV